jgi:AcrR family transcriptional regulator
LNEYEQRLLKKRRDAMMSQENQTKKRSNRDIQASERRQQILDVAKRLFADGGYHATSMRAINKEIGMAEALTYHYFPDGKMEILYTIIREEQEKRIKEIQDFVHSLHDEMTIRDALLFYARRMNERFEKDKDFIQILFNERKLLDRQFLIDVLRLAQQSVDLMVEFLEKRASKGEIREMDFTMAVAQFASQIGVFSAKMSLFEPSFSREKCDDKIEKMVDFTLKLWSK